MTVTVQWSRALPTYPGVRAFLDAAAVFGGRVPSLADPAALAAAINNHDVGGLANAWVAAISAADDEPGGLGFAGEVVIGQAWSITYGGGRSWARLQPEPISGVRVVIGGPIDALESIIRRACAAGAQWDLDRDWHPSSGWQGVPFRAGARRQWAAAYICDARGKEASR